MKESKMKSLFEGISTAEEFIKRRKETFGVMDPKYCRVDFLPTKPVTENEEGVTLWTHADSEYFIPWNELDTPEKVLMIILHLSQKFWINSYNIRALVNLAASRYKWGWFK